MVLFKNIKEFFCKDFCRNSDKNSCGVNYFGGGKTREMNKCVVFVDRYFKIWDDCISK